MAQDRSRTGKTRVVFRRGSPLLKCMILAVLVLSLVALLTIRASIQDAQAHKEALRAQAAELEQQNQQLTQTIEQIDTVEGIKEVATSQLGLVDPDTEFFTPSN